MGEGCGGVEGREARERAGLVRVEKATGSGDEGEARGGNPFHDFGECFQENKDPDGGRRVVGGHSRFVEDYPGGLFEGGGMMAVLEQGPNQARKEGRARLMDFLPDVVGYVVGAGGGGARGLGEGGRDLFLAHREVVSVGGEVNVCQDWGRGSGEEVVEEGRVYAVGGVLVREGRKAGLLPTTR